VKRGGFGAFLHGLRSRDLLVWPVAGEEEEAGQGRAGCCGQLVDVPRRDYARFDVQGIGEEVYPYLVVIVHIIPTPPTSTFSTTPSAPRVRLQHSLSLSFSFSFSVSAD